MFKPGPDRIRQRRPSAGGTSGNIYAHTSTTRHVVNIVGSDRYGRWRVRSGPGFSGSTARTHEQKNCVIVKSCVKKIVKSCVTNWNITSEIHVNGWFPAVCVSQNFLLLLVSNLSVRNFRIFLLMYPESVLARFAGQTALMIRSPVFKPGPDRIRQRRPSAGGTSGNIYAHTSTTRHVVNIVGSDRYGRWRMRSGPGFSGSTAQTHEQKNCVIVKSCVKKIVKSCVTNWNITSEIHVNGWFPAVCVSQNFLLLLVSNLSVRNFRIFLLMYPESVLARFAGQTALMFRPNRSLGNIG